MKMKNFKNRTKKKEEANAVITNDTIERKTNTREVK